MYNTCPITVTVESLLPDNKGQAIVCNANPKETAFSLIEVACRKMNIPYKSHFFLRMDNGDIIHGRDTLAQAFGTKSVHHHTLELDSHYVSKLRWFGAVLGLVLAMAAIAVASGLFVTEKVLWRYGIVADAGSSHTSFVLFNWPEDHMEAVQQIAQCSTEGGEGIDRFVSNPDGIKSHFEPCMNEMMTKLESLGVSDLSSARIYLGATAGMRIVELLSEENATRVMESIENTFAESPFYFVKGDVKILTGQEEGAFSWITTNILSETFKASGPSGDQDKEFTFGSLDMGGASMQIAYECPKGQCNDHLAFDLYNKHYEVFARSDLCYGLNEAMKRYVVSLIYSAYIKNNGKISEELDNLCYTRSKLLKDDWLANFTSVKGDIFDNPCTTDLADAEFALAVKQLPSDFQFVHRRAGLNASDCSKSSEFFIESKACKKLFGEKNCFDYDSKTANVPDLPAYYAMSSYYYEFFRYLNASSTNVSFEFARNRIDELCSPEFTSTDVLYSQTDCFQSTYIFDVITRGYKNFDESNFGTIFFALDINGAEVSWALGFLVNEVTRVSLLGQLKTNFISDEIFVCLLIFGISLLGLSLMAIRKFRKKYVLFKSMTTKN